MYHLLEIAEKSGLFQTLLPVFSDDRWSDIVPTSGFVWIENPRIDLTGRLDHLVQRSLFGNEVLREVSCAIQRLEIDVCLPSSDFLRIVAKTFPGGINFLHANKEQPQGLHLADIPRHQWGSMMRQNQIDFHLHRPAAGEPSLVVCSERKWVEEMIERFRNTPS